MADVVSAVLSVLPVAAVACVIAIDIRFGVFLNGWWQKEPIYREENPRRFWLLEGLMILVLLALSIRPAIEIWGLMH